MKEQVLGQRYRLIDQIGEGGMAFVYLAIDEKLGRKVAVKVLHSHMEKNPDIRKRFQLEAQAISSLDHPNIIKIYDFSGDSSDKLWIVTEVLTGSNLAEYLSKLPKCILNPVVATCMVREILKALSKAHEQKIVHRDIKPENVMITSDGRIKLMDFGIAKDMQHSGLTMTGTFMGSPSYMSPEQIRGKDVDFKSDIYSISILYYEIITGKLPFIGKTTHDVVLKIIEGVYTFPRFIVPNIAPEIDRQITTGMSMDPQQRQATVDQYGSALDEILSRSGFDESHIELERYTKSPTEFLANLTNKQKRTQALSKTAAQDEREPRRRRQTDYQNPPKQTALPPATQQKTAAPSQPTQNKNPNTHGRQVQPASPFPLHSLEKTEVLQQSRVMTPRSQRHQHSHQQSPQQHQEPADGRSPKTTRLLPSQAFVPSGKKLDQASPSPQKPAPPPKHFDSTLETAAAPQARTIPTPRPPAEPVGVYRRLDHRPTQAPPVARVRIFRQPVRQAAFSHSTPSFAAYFFGIFWVGMILGLGLWGFREINNQVSGMERIAKSDRRERQDFKAGQGQDERKASGAPKERLAMKSSGDSGSLGNSEQNDPTGSQAPSSERAPKLPKKTEPRSTAKVPEKSNYNSKERANEFTKKAPAKNQASKNLAKAGKQKTTYTRSDRVIRYLPPQDQGGVSVESVVIKQGKPKKPFLAKTAASSPPPASKVETASEAPGSANPSESTQAAAPTGKGRLMISSHPAAEIYIDGIKVGTTLDATASSGWLTVAAGPHNIELRRSGYATHKISVEVGDDAQLALPTVDLKFLAASPGSGAQSSETNSPQNSGGAGTAPEDPKKTTFTLTIKVSHSPSTVTIRNLETNGLQSISLKTSAKTLTLEPSRYQVRVEYQGKSRERTFDTSAATGNVTFFADF